MVLVQCRVEGEEIGAPNPLAEDEGVRDTFRIALGHPNNLGEHPRTGVMSEEDTNLKTCLEKSLKHRLKGILDAYGVKLSSSAKKHDFSDKAEEIILSEAEEIGRAHV